MTCQEFLDGYSDYLDGELDEARAARWQEHASQCESCRRYDEVLRQGLSLVRDLPAIEPSPDFASKLHRRIWGMEMDDDVGGSSTSLGAVASLAIAAALALIAWSPLMWRYFTPAPEPVVAREEAPAPEPVAAPPALASDAGAAVAGGSSLADRADAVAIPAVAAAESTVPFRLFSGADSAVGEPAPAEIHAASTSDGATVAAHAEAPDSATILEPGPYSPLIIGPPVFQSGRRPGGDVRAVSVSPFYPYD